MFTSRKAFLWVLALFVVTSLVRVAWILLRGGPEASDRAEGYVFATVLGLLVLLLFYPTSRGPSDSG